MEVCDISSSFKLSWSLLVVTTDESIVIVFGGYSNEKTTQSAINRDGSILSAKLLE